MKCSDFKQIFRQTR